MSADIGHSAVIDKILTPKKQMRILFWQTAFHVRLTTGLLLGQHSNKFDNLVKLVTSCQVAGCMKNEVKVNYG